jgi:DNA repair exonuclease SbcCD nuclease subunit
VRAIITADLHLHPWRECSKDGGQDRLADGVSALRQMLCYAKERGCDWVHLGDLKHLKGTWHDDAQNALLGVLGEFPNVCKWFLRGNHDGQPGRKESGLQWLAGLDGVAVIEEPEAHEFAQLKGVAWWPWQKSLDGLPAFLKDAKNAKAKVLMAHAFLSGSLLGPGDHRLPGKGATLEQFGLAGKGRVFDRGFFGDVHKQQTFGVGKSELLSTWYPGSPYGQNWGERETDKGCLFVDTVTGVVERLPVKAPRFVVADWAYIQNLAGKGWANGDFVRVLVPVGTSPKAVERLRDLSGARHFEAVPVGVKSKAEQRASEVHAGLPRKEMLARYVAARPIEGLDPKALLGAGLRLLEG